LDEEEKKLSMNILKTGSSGFIGRNLNEQLSRKYSITAPSSSQLNLLDAYAVQEYLKKALILLFITRHEMPQTTRQRTPQKYWKTT